MSECVCVCVRANSTCMSTENIHTPDRPTFMSYKKLLKELQEDPEITFSDFILMPNFRGNSFTKVSMKKAKQTFLGQAKAEKKRKKSQALSKKSKKKKRGDDDEDEDEDGSDGSQQDEEGGRRQGKGGEQ